MLSGRSEAILRLALADNVSSVELLLRQAQVTGSSITSFNNTYGGAGVFFDRATSSKIMSFKDKVDATIPSTIGIGDGLFSYASSSEHHESITFDRRNRLSKLCVSTTTESYLCNNTVSPEISNLTVSFTRPSLVANIYANNDKATPYSAACLQFDSIKAPLAGYVRSIYIYRSGMIVKKLGECTSS
jgi:hypothetical protein